MEVLRGCDGGEREREGTLVKMRMFDHVREQMMEQLSVLRCSLLLGG